MQTLSIKIRMEVDEDAKCIDVRDMIQDLVEHIAKFESILPSKMTIHDHPLIKFKLD